VGLRSPTRDPQAGTPGAPDLVPSYGNRPFGLAVS